MSITEARGGQPQMLAGEFTAISHQPGLPAVADILPARGIGFVREHVREARQVAGQVLVFSAAFGALAATGLFEKPTPPPTDPKELDRLARAGRGEPHHRGKVENPHQHGQGTGGHSSGHGNGKKHG